MFLKLYLFILFFFVEWIKYPKPNKYNSSALCLYQLYVVMADPSAERQQQLKLFLKMMKKNFEKNHREQQGGRADQKTGIQAQKVSGLSTGK